MNPEQLRDLIQHSLNDLKAVDVQTIDLHNKADFADYMIIASGTSDRHIHAMADKVIANSKSAGCPALGVEGEDSRDWVLVDLGDIIVHLMHPDTRMRYALEKLWTLPSTRC